MNKNCINYTTWHSSVLVAIKSFSLVTDDAMAKAWDASEEVGVRFQML